MPMCTEERKKLLQRGLEIRQKQAEYRRKLENKEIDPEELLFNNNEYEVERMRVSYFLKSIPGIGRVKTERIMEELELEPRTRLEDLSRFQLVELHNKILNIIR